MCIIAPREPIDCEIIEGWDAEEQITVITKDTLMPGSEYDVDLFDSYAGYVTLQFANGDVILGFPTAVLLIKDPCGWCEAPRSSGENDKEQHD